MIQAKTTGLEQRYKALTHPLRLRAFLAFSTPHGRVATTAEIASELGLTVDQLSYHVRALERHGWLELVDESRKAGTGVIERFYRAVEVATYKEATWAALSPAERNIVSEEIVALMVADIAAADEAGSLASRIDTHLSRTPLVIDAHAWEEITGRLLDLYEAGDRAAADSVNRAAAGKSPCDGLISARFMTLFFEAAGWNTRPREPRRPWDPAEVESAIAPPSLTPSLGTRLKALTHPIRVRVFYAFNDPPGRTASPADLAAELGVPLEHMSYHVRALRDAGWIELVARERKGGATEHRYQGVHARLAPLYDYEAWAALSPRQRQTVAREVVALIIADVTAAAAAGTIDSRLDRHLHRAPLMLDERGLAELEQRVTELAEDTERIAAESAERVAAGATAAGEPVAARLALLLFEAPPRKGVSLKKSFS